MVVVVLVVLAGCFVVDLAWEHISKRARDLDAEDRHQALMREVRRHDPDRRLSDRGR